MDKSRQSNTLDIFIDRKDKFFINKSCEQTEPHLHDHNFIEISYVYSGEGIHIIDGNTYSVSKGDIFIIDANTLHEFRSYKDPAHSPLRVYNCIFLPEFIDANLINSKNFTELTYHFLFKAFFPDDTLSKMNINLMGEENNNVGLIYEKMHMEFMLKSDGYLEIIRAYVIELLVIILRQYKSKLKKTETSTIDKNTILQRIVEYIHLNCHKEIRLKDLASKAFLSYSHFGRVFKEYLGVSVTEYIIHLRVQRACELLTTTDMKIKDIASSVGYNDIKFFYSVFKNSMNTTPAMYRKKNSIIK